MRLDKFLCEMNIGSRSQVKTYVKQGVISVNDVVVKSSDLKIDEKKDTVAYRGQVLQYQKYRYYMLNKPQGVVSATQDNTAGTVVELLPPELRKDIFPVGRLDKDTEGLLLLTNDGELAHRLLAPSKHVDKTYYVTIASPLSPDNQRKLEEGVDIGEKKITKPAMVQIVSDKEILLTIHEGKFHQVKRMLKAVENEVIALKRVSFGPLNLDESLQPGKYRELNDLEVQALRGQDVTQ